MKSYAIVACLVVGLAVVLVGAQRDANAEQATIEVSIDTPQADAVDKKCGFDSDCPHGKCKSGKCGGCGFNSDCKGWGVCKSGWCGGCNFDSECKGFGKCSSNKCTKSPY